MGEEINIPLISCWIHLELPEMWSNMENSAKPAILVFSGVFDIFCVFLMLCFLLLKTFKAETHDATNRCDRLLQQIV